MVGMDERMTPADSPALEADASFERFDAGRATPAALVSGEVAAEDAAHPLSLFDMFRIGIGPSSSHTVGPMRAGRAFAVELADLDTAADPDRAPARIAIDLFGSLGATGRGHSTDRAVLLGLAGYAPESVSINEVESFLPTIAATSRLSLSGGGTIPFDIASDIRFIPRTRLPYHVNALTLTAWRRKGTCTRGEEHSSGGEGEDAVPSNSELHGLHPSAEREEQIILKRTYYSVGGGFVMVHTTEDPLGVESLAAGQAALNMDVPAPHPFTTGAELLAACEASGFSVAELVRRNEEAVRPRKELDDYLDLIANTMFECVDAGTSTSGILPGGLDVPRRAQGLATRLFEGTSSSAGVTASSSPWVCAPEDPMRAMDWVTLFALAVNEENAAGHRVVTAPTNGAARVIPAVLGYLVLYCREAGADRGTPSAPSGLGRASAPLKHMRIGVHPIREEQEDSSSLLSQAALRRHHAVHEFLLAATAIGALIKTNASIAGAEVGCQGEVGSASAMAAAGLAQALGGTPEQVENAAEIAMEHSLGLTCDPVAGLVQIPCIERNAIAAVKAIHAARMALWSDGRHMVSLDVVIETMRQTGNDMLSKYKETSEGGLAVNVVEC